MLLYNFASDIKGIPAFEQFVITDINPLGGTEKRRKIHNPNDPMRILHARLIRHLRSLPVDLQYATGARPGSSPVRNVARHRENRHFYLLDIQSAYQNVNGQRLAEVLCSQDPILIDQEEQVYQFLAQFCLDPLGGLAIGAPASPDLFNIYCGVLIDQLLGDLCQQYGLIYTRYLDDLTFSSSGDPIGKRKRRTIRGIFGAAGFTVNHQKSGVFDLAKGPIVINGVGLELGGRLYLPRHFLRKIRGLLNLAWKSPSSVDPDLIYGLMGVFWAIAHLRRSFTTTERKLFELYQRVHQLYRYQGRAA